MTINDEIIIIANQLANEGKKPTVALVKPKLRNPAALPTIISALKSWTHDPELIGQVITPEKNTIAKTTLSPTSSEIESAIKQALLPIEKELAQIKALLIELTQK